MSKTDKKIVPERVKIPAYGDERIEEAKGKWRRQTQLQLNKVPKLSTAARVVV